MSKKLWGTRFSKKTDALVDRFTSSISVDKLLAKYDCLGSIAHARMLGKTKIIKPSESKLIVKGLKSILKKIESGRFKVDVKAEDIHSNIQNELRSKIGATADKLHTARSRNDQVVLDVKMYCKDAILEISKLLVDFQKAILKFANKNINIIIPAHTHLQPAQYVLLSHHMLAYMEMLERDKTRLVNTFNLLDEMPLGACALSGTSLPIDRKLVAKDLGFKKITTNSIDTVSDRDFIIEILADLSIMAIHLSRIAEDLILWSTKEFNLVEIDWSFCTGSSIMPHKKNPDVLELIRSSVGNICGNLSSVLMIMKGLPLTYNRDMQFDKKPLFDGVSTIEEILNIFKQLFANLGVNKKRITKKLDDESLFSVDIVDYLIKKGLSYRQAHDTVGKMVKQCLDKGKKISSLDLTQLKKYSPKFNNDVKKILNAKASVKGKTSLGATSPMQVKRQLKKWKVKLNA